MSTVKQIAAALAALSLVLQGLRMNRNPFRPLALLVF